MKAIANESTVMFSILSPRAAALRCIVRHRGSVQYALRKDVWTGRLTFTDCVLLFCFFALLGSIVFSRGSKKVLFWRTVYKNSDGTPCEKTDGQGDLQYRRKGRLACLQGKGRGRYSYQGLVIR